MQQEFPSNSRKAATSRPEAEPKPKIERVTTGEVGRKKRGLGRQFKDTFIGGSARTAMEYMFVDVIVPSAKDMLAEAFQSGIEKLIYGDQRPRRGAMTPPGVGGYSSAPRVNYNQVSHSRPPTSTPAPKMLSMHSRTRGSFDELVIQSRSEAAEVLERMYDILSSHGQVSVADLYALTGIQSAHTDFKWGWTGLQGSDVDRTRSGQYILRLPDPQPLA